MLTEQVDEYYYITLMNENYVHPEMPEGAAEGVIRGMYKLSGHGTRDPGPGKGKSKKAAAHVNLLGSGTILREAMAAAELLAADFGVAADIYSCPSFNELRRDGVDVERHNRLHPLGEPRVPYVSQVLAKAVGPTIAATDYVRAYAEQIRPYLPHGMRYTVLGTDGFGRSDTRANLRRFFEVDRYQIAVAALSALADEGTLQRKVVAEAIKKYGIDVDRPNPGTV
jgi:pyruvate dehydrogenase E1 component